MSAACGHTNEQHEAAISRLDAWLSDTTEGRSLSCFLIGHTVCRRHVRRPGHWTIVLPRDYEARLAAGRFSGFSARFRRQSVGPHDPAIEWQVHYMLAGCPTRLKRIEAICSCVDRNVE